MSVPVSVKLRAFWPQMLSLAVANAAALCAAATGGVTTLCGVEAVVVAVAFGAFGVVTTLAKAIRIAESNSCKWYVVAGLSDDERCYPCDRALREKAEAIAEVDKLKEALMTLRLPS